MKKTLLNALPEETPQELRNFISAAHVFDSSSSPEAKVYFIDREGGYYLKRSGKGALEKEAHMTKFFHAKGLGAEVLQYLSHDSDWLLTAAVSGEDCLHEKHLSDPKRLCDTIAHELRRLHETDYTGCPVPDRTADYLAGAERSYRQGTYDPSHFPDSFGYPSAQTAYEVLSAGKGPSPAASCSMGIIACPTSFCGTGGCPGSSTWATAGWATGTSTSFGGSGAWNST